jgi:hypothetical protein
VGSIPVWSHVHGEVRMLKNLEEIFELANISSSTLHTKLELENLV